MEDIWRIKDTYELLGVVEQIKPPASYLADTFFPRKMPVSYSSYVAVEFRKQGRILAPYVIKGGSGVNINRGGSRIQLYSAPMVAPKRTIGLGDIELRQFGEPPIFSSVTPAERAALKQAEDLNDLLRTITNRRNKQAADILQTGETTIRGYADDGKTVQIDTIKFDWNGLIEPVKDWSDSDATIYDDIKGASERIQEESGFIPTLMVCGSNVEKYLLNNEEIFKWLSIPNRQNVQLMSFSPHYTSPQARFIGYISALNLEIISYTETYTDDLTGEVKPFLDPDTAIIGNPGRGKQLFGMISYMDQAGDWQTIAAENVPVYIADPKSQQSSLTIFSRFLLVPEVIEDYVTIKTKKAG